VIAGVVEIEAIASRLRVRHVRHPIADDLRVRAILDGERDERRAGVVVPTMPPAERIPRTGIISGCHVERLV
jgi:hypothetical protein